MKSATDPPQRLNVGVVAKKGIGQVLMTFSQGFSAHKPTRHKYSLHISQGLHDVRRARPISYFSADTNKTFTDNAR